MTNALAEFSMVPINLPNIIQIISFDLFATLFHRDDLQMFFFLERSEKITNRPFRK